MTRRFRFSLQTLLESTGFVALAAGCWHLECNTDLIVGFAIPILILLAPVAGKDAPYETRMAWRIAYALHNDALAVIDGKSFDCEAALGRVANIGRIIGGADGQQIADEMRRAI